MSEQNVARLDNGPNKTEVASFESYRDLCDEHSGLMRVGITVPELYGAVAIDKTTEFIAVDNSAVPIVSSVDALHIPEEGQEPEYTADKSALVPLELIPEHMQHGLTAMEQFLLDDEQTREVLVPREGTRLRIKDVPELLVGRTKGELQESHGEPQFTVLTAYDVSDCNEMRENAPLDLITRAGHRITTDKEQILANLPALVELHEAIFNRQAARIGYYDGLVGDIIERFLADDAFIGAAAFDKDTGKPFMFAIFAHGIDGLDQIPWLNKRHAQETIDESNPTFVMPIAITARFNGMGVFQETVTAAMHETLYRTQEPSMLYTFYNANLQSIGYTPRIINAGAEQNGARLGKSVIEASVLTNI